MNANPVLGLAMRTKRNRPIRIDKPVYHDAPLGVKMSPIVKSPDSSSLMVAWVRSKVPASLSVISPTGRSGIGLLTSCRLLSSMNADLQFDQPSAGYLLNSRRRSRQLRSFLFVGMMTAAKRMLGIERASHD